jgi:hypothetical protein
MTEMIDRKELERRLEQARRMARENDDPLTKGRLARLIKEKSNYAKSRIA